MSTEVSGGSASQRVQEKRSRRRAEILEAALRAFRERGYHSTTLDDIAAHVGIGNTALYHYFPDKESILYSCHRESLAEVHRLLAKARQVSPSPATQLRYVIREHVRVMMETLQGSPLAFEVPALTPERQALVIGERDRYERALRDIIAAGIACGEFRPVDPKIAAFVILGAINWIARWYRPEGALHSPEVGNQFADYLVGGLACH